MAGEKKRLESIRQDLRALEEEISRELIGGDNSWTGLPQFLEQNGYWKQLVQIRDRVFELIKALQERLDRASRASHFTADGPTCDLLLDSTEDIAELLAIWERLETLFVLLEQRLAARELKASAIDAGVRVSPSPSESGLLTSTTRVVQGWITTLMGWIKRISKQLWSIIAGLLTPKEWKIGGSLGSGPLGLANATLEITFGKLAAP